MSELTPEFVQALEKVTAKRARTVIDHIIKHGVITTEELKEQYGYSHPPRAARDVREQGIPLETTSAIGSDGRRMAAYKFADLSKIERHKLGGRQVFSKQLREALYSKQSGRCGVCGQNYEIRYLQVDHRVPYEVAGELAASASDESAYLLICASCQRSKSWSCEHCENWRTKKSVADCQTCYWASPEEYRHIALTETRRVVLVWEGKAVATYEQLVRKAKAAGLSLPEFIQRQIR